MKGIQEGDMSSAPAVLLPVSVLFACALYKLLTPSRRQTVRLWKVIGLDVIVAVVSWFLLLPNPSIAPWWGGFARVFALWPDSAVGSYFPVAFRHGGPLGYGCYKILEVISALVLWRIVHSEWPPIELGPPPSLKVWLVVGFLSLLVNAVLLIWSRALHTSGDHKGVQDFVQSTLKRQLTLQEHAQILGMALLNAACEELSSRFFWRQEYEQYLSRNQANIAQALAFGIWHYHGIPSGMIGVGLTFVYGGIMGMLDDFGNGLILPVAAHTIADYYIFAIIARSKQSTSKKMA